MDGEGDEEKHEEVCQSHAEEKNVQAVFTNALVFGEERKGQQVGAETDAHYDATSASKDQSITVSGSLWDKTRQDMEKKVCFELHLNP